MTQTAFLDHLRGQLDGIRADGMWKHERALGGAQVAN